MFFLQENPHAVSCDRELSECAKIVHYVTVGEVYRFLRKKDKSQTVPSNLSFCFVIKINY